MNRMIQRKKAAMATSKWTADKRSYSTRPHAGPLTLYTTTVGARKFPSRRSRSGEGVWRWKQGPPPQAACANPPPQNEARAPAREPEPKYVLPLGASASRESRQGLWASRHPCAAAIPQSLRPSTRTQEPECPPVQLFRLCRWKQFFYLRQKVDPFCSARAAVGVR